MSALEKKNVKDTLTNRQIEFCKLIVDGRHSNSECARQAGYNASSARFQASRLLNGRDFPLVAEYISELREERQRKYGVDLIGQLKRLYELSAGAEEAGQYSAAINAEKIRSALGGLVIDRREAQHLHKYENMSREEIEAQLKKLRSEFPAAFVEAEYSVVDEEAGTKPMATGEKIPAPKLPRNAD